MRCDYILPGSVFGKKGSAGAERGHKIQLREKKVPRNLCCSKAGIKIFKDYGPDLF